VFGGVAADKHSMEGWFRRSQGDQARGPYRAELAEELRLGVSGRRSEADLHICPRCGSHLVQPAQWSPLDSKRWRVELRCPECTWIGGGAYEQAVLDRYDEILDAGVQSLMSDLDRLERANMEEDMERFLTAIDHNRILPEDF
jgi:predicted RNA-binding Zn-ribbon protein involved in translation (DUF1610 family)